MQTAPQIEEVTVTVDSEQPLTEEQIQAELDREAARIAALDAVGASLEKWKDESVTWRWEFEQRWTDDYNQYNSAGTRFTETKQQRGGIHTGNPPNSDEQFRDTSDNITRPKVIITASRLGDMLFPTNDSNWTLEASPKPDVPEELLPPPPPGPVDEQTGQPTQGQYTPEQKLEAIKTFAQQRARAMYDTIDDQFEESQYAEHGRGAIFDACLYGTGVMRGPILRNRVKHAWGSAPGSGYSSEMVKRAKPSVEQVDLWSFFPRPARCLDECEGVFFLHVMTPGKVRQLARQPGFDKNQLRRLLETAPFHGTLAVGAIDRGQLRPDAQIVLTNKYTVWEYRGPIPKDAFAAFLSGMLAQGGISDEDANELALALEADQMSEIDAEVWCSQGIVLKMALSTLPPGDLGVYVYNYETNPNAIFGYGVPYLCRDDQHATNQLWHAIMLNSMMSAGPQIGVKAGMLMPLSNENGSAARATSLSATKPRVWALSDEIDDIREALSVHVIPNVTAPLLNVYERAKANADEHTMTPMIAQGEPTSAVPTSSGMAMLMNAANVVMRRLAKQWDDKITVPLVSAFYEWNMMFNPDESIRGDYCVIPKGASHLLIKDVQAQHIQFATTLFTNNPVLAPYMKGGQFARKNIEILDLSVTEMLHSDEEVAANQKAQGEQPDPETIKAQAAQATAEAAMKRAETDAAVAQAKIEYDRWERDLANQERMADIAARERITEMQLEMQRMQLAQAYAAADADARIQMQKIASGERVAMAKVESQNLATQVTARLDAERIAQDDGKLDAELKAEAPNARIQ
jgi:hypothetical protein